MLLHVFLSLLMSLFILAVVWLCHRYRLHHGPAHGKGGGRSLLPRRLKPRTPLDCPACCLSASRSSSGRFEPVSVRPWQEVKSRRGAPKRVKTAGFACPNRACVYYGMTDAEIHALVGDGLRGQAERIQRLRCQACQTALSARRHTLLYRLKTPSHRVALVLGALAEGLDISAAERVFGIRHATITSWLLRAGAHAQTLHERSFRDLMLAHVQVDELRTRLRSHTQVLWLWVAIDPRSQVHTCAPTGPADASDGSAAHPQAARAVGSWLPAPLHQRWPQCLLLCLNSSFWGLDQGSRVQEAESEPMASSSWSDGWPSEKELTFGVSWCESSTSSSWGHRQRSHKPYRLWAFLDESTRPGFHGST